MNDQRPTRDTISLEEATIFNMREIAAIVKVPEHKGLYTKHDLCGGIGMPWGRTAGVHSSLNEM